MKNSVRDCLLFIAFYTALAGILICLTYMVEQKAKTVNTSEKICGE